jgi:hypothetical protein
MPSQPKVSDAIASQLTKLVIRVTFSTLNQTAAESGLFDLGSEPHWSCAVFVDKNEPVKRRIRLKRDHRRSRPKLRAILVVPIRSGSGECIDLNFSKKVVRTHRSTELVSAPCQGLFHMR